MQVDEASALEDTLARLRQRYALYFYLPEGSASSDQQTVQVDLSNNARLRFDQADIHYRRVYMASNSSSEHTGPVVTRAQQPGTATTIDSPPSLDQPAPRRRSVAVNDDSGSPVNTVDDDAGTSSGQAASPSKESQPSTQSTQPASQPSQTGGWPRAPQSNTPPQ